MRKVPPGIHRVPGDLLSPPEYWVVWLGEEGKVGSVKLGKTKRLEKHLRHRAFPETGEWPQDFTGWVNAVQWLLDLHRGHEATSDGCRAVETEAIL